MSAGDDELVGDRLAPAESFERLSHEIRIRTVRTLDADGPLRHSALRERVGVDDPGQFNYHLQKLDDQFVSNGDDGSRLTHITATAVGTQTWPWYASDPPQSVEESNRSLQPEGECDGRYSLPNIWRVLVRNRLIYETR